MKAPTQIAPFIIMEFIQNSGKFCKSVHFMIKTLTNVKMYLRSLLKTIWFFCCEFLFAYSFIT